MYSTNMKHPGNSCKETISQIQSNHSSGIRSLCMDTHPEPIVETTDFGLVKSQNHGLNADGLRFYPLFSLSVPAQHGICCRKPGFVETTSYYNSLPFFFNFSLSIRPYMYSLLQLFRCRQHNHQLGQIHAHNATNFRSGWSR